MPSVPPAGSRLTAAAGWLLLLTVITLPFSEGVKNIALVLCVLAVLWPARGRPAAGALLPAWLLLLASAALSSLTAAVPADSWKGVIDPLRLTLFYLAGADLLRAARWRGRALATAWWSGVAAALWGLAVWGAAGWRILQQTGGWRDPHQWKWMLTQNHLEILSLGQFNHTAIYLALVLLIPLGRWTADGAWRKREVAAALPVLAAVILTTSRAAFGIWCLCALAALVYRRCWRLLAAGALLLLLLAGVLLRADWTPDKVFSLQSLHMRVAIWKNAATVAAAHPLLGIGLNHFGKVDFAALGSAAEGRADHVHNLYLNTLVQQGGAGLLALLLLAGCAARALWRTRRREAAWLTAAGAWVLTFGIGMFNTTLHHEHGLLFCLLLAAGLAAAETDPA